MGNKQYIVLTSGHYCTQGLYFHLPLAHENTTTTCAIRYHIRLMTVISLYMYVEVLNHRIPYYIILQLQQQIAYQLVTTINL